MIVTSAKAQNLATFFLLDPTLERSPEPIRFQPNVKVIIPFSEYIVFIDKYLDKRDFLQTPTALLKAYLKEGNYYELGKCYYKDMAVAIIKELYYCSLYGRKPTKIRHDIEGSQYAISMDQIRSKYDKAGHRIIDNTLIAMLKERGYRAKVGDLSSFSDEWLYARGLIWSLRDGTTHLWNRSD